MARAAADRGPDGLTKTVHRVPAIVKSAAAQ